MKRNTPRLISILILATMVLTLLVGCEFNFGTPSNKPSGGDSGDGTSGDTGADDTVSLFTVCINEVCGKNTMNGMDPIDGAYYDWIELHNNSDTDFSLNGYGISDKKSSIKHVFGDVTVPANGFLILWACGDLLMDNKPNGGIYLPFSISAQGETLYFFSTRGSVLQQMTVPALDDDEAYGFTEDHGSIPARLTPSPARTNQNARVHMLDDSVVTFSHESGFYDEPITLKLTLPVGFTAYYTTDCTEPTKYSTVFPAQGLSVENVTGQPNKYSTEYTGLIDQAYEGYTRTQTPVLVVDKCTVLRVVAYDGNGKRTDVITKSYFVGYQKVNGEYTGYTGMSVVSLVSDPDSLYGDDGLFTNSIYWSKGTDAFEKASERQTSFAYFAADKSYEFDQEIGIRLHGTSTRKHAQKSLTLFARQTYGNSAFEKTIVGTASECKSMVLRTDGNSKIQEGFLQSLVSDRELSTCDYTPTVVFVDGEYYGVYNLYERFSDNYVEEYYGVDNDNVYIVKKGSEGNVTDALTAYKNAFFVNGNTSQPKSYAQLCETVDMQSLIDLIATETYLCNADWSFSQNIACWRVIDPSAEDPDNPYADGKWRFVLYDLDISIGAWAPAKNREGLGGYANNFVCDATYNGFTTKGIWTQVTVIDMDIVKKLMESQEFCRRFCLTFSDLINVNFEAEATVAKVEAALNVYAPNMRKHYARFGIPVTAYEPGSTEGATNANWKIKTYFGGYPYSANPTAISKDVWLEEMQFAIDFFAGHGEYAMEDMKDVFELTGSLATVTLCVDGNVGGSLVLNGVTAVSTDATGAWSGSYYTDFAPTVTAVAADGYCFTGWTVSGGAIADASSETATLTSFTGDVTLTATFAPIA